MRQEPLGIRAQVDRGGERLLAPPPRAACDTALRLDAIRDLRRNGGQWRTLAHDNAAHHRGEGRYVPGNRACALARIALCEGAPYGTIPTEAVTRWLLLRDESRFAAE